MARKTKLLYAHMIWIVQTGISSYEIYTGQSTQTVNYSTTFRWPPLYINLTFAEVINIQYTKIILFLMISYHSLCASIKLPIKLRTIYAGLPGMVYKIYHLIRIIKQTILMDGQYSDIVSNILSEIREYMQGSEGNHGLMHTDCIT